MARPPMSLSWSLVEIIVSERGARRASTAGGRVTTVCVEGGAKKPCVTIAIKTAPEATFVWNQQHKDLC